MLLIHALPEQEAALRDSLAAAGITADQITVPITSTARKLPRTSDGQFCPIFQAGGHNYTITDANEGVAIMRYHQFCKLYAPWQWGYRDFDGLTRYLDETILGLMSHTDMNRLKVDAVNRLSSLRDGIVERGQERMDRALQICTIFILREGEDATRWDANLALQKIEDWKNEGYDVFDFFLLVAGISSSYVDAYNSVIERTARLRETLSPLTGATATNPTAAPGA